MLKSRCREEGARTMNPEAARPDRAMDTRIRLLDAAAEVVCDRGLAAASARTIAAAAGVNQALVFYHFGTVAELIEAASNRAVDSALAHYRIALDGAVTVDQLLAVGRDLQGRERAVGNVAFMAQILSGAGHDPAIARAARYAMSAWTGQVRAALDRVLGGTVIAELVDTAGLADLVSAGFIGLELYGTVDAQSASAALSSLDSLGRLVDRLGAAGPVARRALGLAARHYS